MPKKSRVPLIRANASGGSGLGGDRYSRIPCPEKQVRNRHVTIYTGSRTGDGQQQVSSGPLLDSSSGFIESSSADIGTLPQPCCIPVEFPTVTMPRYDGSGGARSDMETVSSSKTGPLSLQTSAFSSKGVSCERNRGGGNENSIDDDSRNDNGEDENALFDHGELNRGHITFLQEKTTSLMGDDESTGGGELRQLIDVLPPQDGPEVSGIIYGRRRIPQARKYKDVIQSMDGRLRKSPRGTGNSMNLLRKSGRENINSSTSTLSARNNNDSQIISPADYPVGGPRILNSILLSEDAYPQAMMTVNDHTLCVALEPSPLTLYTLSEGTLKREQSVSTAYNVTAMVAVRMYCYTVQPLLNNGHAWSDMATLLESPTQHFTPSINSSTPSRSMEETLFFWYGNKSGNINVIDATAFYTDDGSILNAHSGAITFMHAVSYKNPNTGYLASCIWTSGLDRQLKIWDGSSRRNLMRRALPATITECCTVSLDVNPSVWTTSSSEFVVRVWEYDGKEKNSSQFLMNSNALKFTSEIRTLRYHDSTHLVWVCLRAGGIMLLSAEDYVCVQALSITAIALEFSPRNHHTAVILGYYNHSGETLLSGGGYPSASEAALMPSIITVDIPSSGRVGRDASFMLTKDMVTIGQRIELPCMSPLQCSSIHLFPHTDFGVIFHGSKDNNKRGLLSVFTTESASPIPQIQKFKEESGNVTPAGSGSDLSSDVGNAGGPCATPGGSGVNQKGNMSVSSTARSLNAERNFNDYVQQFQNRGVSKAGVIQSSVQSTMPYTGKKSQKTNTEDGSFYGTQQQIRVRGGASGNAIDGSFLGLVMGTPGDVSSAVMRPTGGPPSAFAPHSVKSVLSPPVRGIGVSAHGGAPVGNVSFMSLVDGGHCGVSLQQHQHLQYSVLGGAQIQRLVCELSNAGKQIQNMHKSLPFQYDLGRLYTFAQEQRLRLVEGIQMGLKSFSTNNNYYYYSKNANEEDNQPAVILALAQQNAIPALETNEGRLIGEVLVYISAEIQLLALQKDTLVSVARTRVLPFLSSCSVDPSSMMTMRDYYRENLSPSEMYNDLVEAHMSKNFERGWNSTIGGSFSNTTTTPSNNNESDNKNYSSDIIINAEVNRLRRKCMSQSAHIGTLLSRMQQQQAQLNAYEEGVSQLHIALKAGYDALTQHRNVDNSCSVFSKLVLEQLKRGLSALARPSSPSSPSTGLFSSYRTDDVNTIQNKFDSACEIVVQLLWTATSLVEHATHSMENSSYFVQEGIDDLENTGCVHHHNDSTNVNNNINNNISIRMTNMRNNPQNLDTREPSVTSVLVDQNNDEILSISRKWGREKQSSIADPESADPSSRLSMHHRSQFVYSTLSSLVLGVMNNVRTLESQLRTLEDVFQLMLATCYNTAWLQNILDKIAITTKNDKKWQSKRQLLLQYALVESTLRRNTELTSLLVFSDISFAHNMVQVCNYECEIVAAELILQNYTDWAHDAEGEDVSVAGASTAAATAVDAANIVFTRSELQKLTGALTMKKLSSHTERKFAHDNNKDNISNNDGSQEQKDGSPDAIDSLGFFDHQTTTRQIDRISSNLILTTVEVERINAAYRNELHNRIDALKPFSVLCLKLKDASVGSFLEFSNDKLPLFYPFISGIVKTLFHNDQQQTGSLRDKEKAKKAKNSLLKLYEWRLTGLVIWFNLWMSFICDVLILVPGFLKNSRGDLLTPTIQGKGRGDGEAQGDGTSPLNGEHITYLLSNMIQWSEMIERCELDMLIPLHRSLKTVLGNEEGSTLLWGKHQQNEENGLEETLCSSFQTENLFTAYFTQVLRDDRRGCIDLLVPCPVSQEQMTSGADNSSIIKTVAYNATSLSISEALMVKTAAARNAYDALDKTLTAAKTLTGVFERIEKMLTKTRVAKRVVAEYVRALTEIKCSNLNTAIVLPNNFVCPRIEEKDALELKYDLL